MSSGQVNKALWYLLKKIKNTSGGILSLDDDIPDSANDPFRRTTQDILVEEHPPGKPALRNYLL